MMIDSSDKNLYGYQNGRHVDERCQRRFFEKNRVLFYYL